MLLELLLASQLSAAPGQTEFELLRDKAAAQEVALNGDERHSLLLLRARLYAQALSSCGLSNSKERIDFDAIAEIREHGRMKVVAQSGKPDRAARCVTKYLNQSMVPELPFLPELIRFSISYVPGGP
ncbi:hypothetical protein MNR01_12510 [Lysobacter sp. S4-A87]|uniref:hypothetical protein n=1 Tax=Lysobacter sp. S4-A87 TaxID=2925843 RepID=UPI001F534886|nr:hypothetical protein [Lysobacter sp. S4-A87]UNK48567.1 hypothetical protein MNR01_12510 [Lysobacter sp. S4-A87]